MKLTICFVILYLEELVRVLERRGNKWNNGNKGNNGNGNKKNNGNGNKGNNGKAGLSKAEKEALKLRKLRKKNNSKIRRL